MAALFESARVLKAKMYSKIRKEYIVRNFKTTVNLMLNKSQNVFICPNDFKKIDAVAKQ